MPDPFQSKNNYHFDDVSFKVNKMNNLRLSIIFLILSIVFITNSIYPIIMQINMIFSLVFGIIFIFLSYYKYYLFKKLPIHEAIELAKSFDGIIKYSDFFIKLRLNKKQTDELVQKLIILGFVEQYDKDNDFIKEYEIKYKVIN